MEWLWGNDNITLTDAKKAFNKILHLFIVKTLNKLRLEGNNLNITFVTAKNGKQLKYPSTSEWLNSYTSIPWNATQQQKEIN